MTDRANMSETRLANRFRRTRAWTAKRRRDDRGTTLVEAAIVTPVFILVILGIFEFSGYVMARSSMNAAVQAGARVAVVAGNEDLADQAILERMSREGAAASEGTNVILEIKIWRVDRPEDEEPVNADCYQIGQPSPPATSAKCNLYINPNKSSMSANAAFPRAQLPIYDPETDTGGITSAYADYWFGCTGAGDPEIAHKYDCGWPPATRINTAATPPGCIPADPPVPPCRGPDTVGIHIKLRHYFYTGFFGDYVDMEATSYSTIEPQRFGGTT